MLTYRITLTDHCRSLESFIRNLFPDASPGYRHQLLKKGQVCHNEGPAKGSAMLLLDDIITIKESAKTTALCASASPLIDILYEDDQLLIINKEPGLAAHKADDDGGKNLVVIAEQFLASHQKTCKLRPVNRIDLGTSGSVIMAKNANSAGVLGSYIKHTGLGKIYLAAVEGVLDANGVIDMPIDGKESLTSYQLLYQGKQAAIAALFPVSGRKHQLRRHLAAIGSPVIGDRRYGKANSGMGTGHALHAFAITLEHPATAAKMMIYAPLPLSLLTLLHQISGDSFEALLAMLPALAQ